MFVLQLSKVETVTFEGELFDGLPSGLLPRTHFLEALDLQRALDQRLLELYEFPVQFRCAADPLCPRVPHSN